MAEKIFYELAKCFRDLHYSQLKTCGLPEQYWDNLFYKIQNEVSNFIMLLFLNLIKIFDAGEFFQICMRVDEDENIIGYKAKYVKQNGLKLSDKNGLIQIGLNK